MVHFTSVVEAPCVNLVLLLYKEQGTVTSLRHRSNSGKERAEASWKLEMLLLPGHPPGLTGPEHFVQSFYLL